MNEVEFFIIELRSEIILVDEHFSAIQLQKLILKTESKKLDICEKLI